MKDKAKSADLRRMFPLFLALALVLIMSSILMLTYPSQAQVASPSPTLAAPDELTVNTSSAKQVNLTWRDNSDNEDGFRIERASDRSFTNDLSSFKTGPDAVSFTDTGTGPLTIYYYRVLAYNAEGESAWSNIAVIMTPDLGPEPPSKLMASSPGAFTVDLSWTDNSNNEVGFKVQRATDSSFTNHLASFTTEANVFVCEDQTVPAGNYYYRVAAFNASGDSTFSNSVGVTVDSKIIDDTLLFGNQVADVATTGFAPFYIPFQVDGKGQVQGDNDIKLNTFDTQASVTIPQSLKMLNINDHPLFSLSYQAPDILPEPPVGKFILQGYEFGPPYSTFDPGIEITLKFDTASLPAGAKSGDIQLDSWDGSQWEAIGGTNVNLDTGEISANVTHFSTLVILCNNPTLSSPFSVSDLLIFPRYSNAGDLVRIQVTAKNSGATPGNYELVLNLNNETEETRYLAIESNTAYTETFDLNDLKVGYYTVTLNGLKDYFIVQSVASATASSPEPSVTTSVPSSTYNVEIPTPGFIPSGPNITLIIIIVSSMLVILLASLAIFFIRRR